MSDNGTALPPTTANSWSNATCTSAGATNVRFHALRHFYAGGLITAGCNVVTVQRALGHSNATTTLNTYSHLWQSAKANTRCREPSGPRR